MDLGHQAVHPSTAWHASRPGARAPVPVGPEHSPVGSRRWMDGRRRGGKGIEEEGKGWSGGRAPPCVGPGGTPGGPGPLWLAWRMAREGVRRGPFNGGCLPGPFDECPALRGGGLDWDVYIICVHVSGPEEPCPDSTSWTGMEGGVAPCRAPTRYISPPDEMTHVKASLAVGDAARSAALPRGAHRGPRRPPSKRNLTMSSSNGGRRLPGPSRPRGPSRRAFNGDDGA